MNTQKTLEIQYYNELPDSFNWLAILKDLRAGAELSPGDHFTLCVLAKQWPTCACGQLCQALPRNLNGAPEDKQLSLLGQKFHSRVGQRKWDKALEAFHEIEARTTTLLEGTESK